MKISSFRICNFRSIADTGDIDCRKLMVFIGRNNAGKSNILKALDVFFNASRPDPADVPYFASNGDATEITVTFEELGGKLRKQLGITGDRFTCTKSFGISKNGQVTKLGTPREFLNGRELASYKGPFGGITGLREFLRKQLPKYYYVPALRNLADEGKFKRGSLIQDLMLPLLDDDISADGQTIATHVSTIENILKNRCEAIEDEISAILRYRVDDFESLFFDVSDIDIKKALSPGVFVKTVSSTGALSALLQGAGTQNFIILALAQYYARGKSPVDLVIAFEEPEISLHSTAQRNMLDLVFKILENKRQQIFLTTHSTIFIDRTADNACLVKKTGGKTTLSVPQKTKEITSQLGIRGSDYFTTDGLVFVEGSTDYEVFKTWAEAKAPASWQKHVFTFVPLGGLPSIEHFRAEDCKHLCNQVYAILDRDIPAIGGSFKRSTREIVNKICNELGGQVKILKKKELENYFTLEAVKEVFPEAEAVMRPEEFADPGADVKGHLTEIVQKRHYEKYHGKPDYDEERTKEQKYNRYHAKLIAEKMVERDEVPGEFIEILESFAKDLERKMPKY